MPCITVERLLSRMTLMISVVALLPILAACQSDIWKTGDSDVPYLYEIAPSQTHPNRIQFTLHLSKDSSRKKLRLFSRAGQMGLKSQVEMVKCNGVEMVDARNGFWELPMGCLKASWYVRAIDFDPSVSTPSDQQTLAMGDWWLVSGPSSLLRVEGAKASQAKVVLLGGGGSKETRGLSSLSSPPSFYVLGRPPKKTISSEDLRLRYVAEDLETVSQFVDPKRHLAALGYFVDILGKSNKRHAQELTVVWFGVTEDRRQVSGAAGANTILANYILSDKALDPLVFYRPFVLVLHEQFHQVQSGGALQPQWMGESLAQYYALKAATKAWPENEAVLGIFREDTQSATGPTIGLLAVQKQIDKERNYQNYGLFYASGVHFWFEVDQHLKRASGGASDLDAVLPDLLDVTFPDRTQVPERLREVLSAVDPSDLDQMIEKYLMGTKESVSSEGGNSR